MHVRVIMGARFVGGRHHLAMICTGTEGIGQTKSKAIKLERTSDERDNKGVHR